MSLTKDRESALKAFANDIRWHTLETLNNLGFGHYGGSLSIVEALAVLYGEVLNISPDNFDERDRDYFVLSKGHAGPALYSTLHLKGFFDKTFLSSLNQNGTSLPSHPDRNLTPGVDMTTGSLGQGISAATGIAKGLDILGSSFSVFTIVGDGELNEGQCWEAIQFASHHQLKNFFVLVDDNKMQLDGTTSSICNPLDYVDKFQVFGFDAVRVDGQSISAIYDAIATFKASTSQRPKCIILDTVKGQGVEELTQMSNNHHLRLTEELKQDLEQVVERLKGGLND
ncbi:transketolase [Streptococcus fryi]